MILESVITCPVCRTQRCETMPVNACVCRFDCSGCGALVKPLAGDCCVFCSYGSVKCPPMQDDGAACCQPAAARHPVGLP